MKEDAEEGCGYGRRQKKVDEGRGKEGGKKRMRLVKSAEQMEDGREGKGEKAEKYVAEEKVRKECCA